MEDESIIALYWQRDSRAISETDIKYGALCRSISGGIVRSREDAEECVNDTYLAAWNAIPPQRPRRFGAYICAVVRNISAPRGKLGGTLLAAALIVSLLTVSAFAAERYFGLFDFFGGRRLSEDARRLIERDVPAVPTAENGDFPLDCRVTEALTDGRSVRLVAELSADEAAGLLLVPEDAMESDCVRDFGIESDLTLAEYAQEKGLEPLWVGVGIEYDGALDIGTQSIEQRAVSDGVMDIMITAVTGTPEEDMTFTLVCTARGRDAKTVEDIARRELTVTLKNGAQSIVTEYVPTGDGAVPGTAATVVSAMVMQTEVETYLEVRYTADYADEEEMNSGGAVLPRIFP